MSENLKTLNNQELEDNTLKLVGLEKKMLGELIEHLAEIYQRRLFVFYNYASLSEHCMKKLALRADQAYKRAQAAKIAVLYPQSLKLLKEGKISLSSINIAASKMTHKNSTKILNSMQEKSNLELKFYLSAIDVNGEVTRDQEERIEVKLKMNKDCFQKWLKVKALLSHNKKSMEEEELVETLLDHYLDQHDPIKKAARGVKRKQEDEPAKAEKRYLKKRLYHQVMLRDAGQCSFRDQEGTRCQETRFLEIDHIKMFSQKKEHRLENMRLLCSRHNKLLAERSLGIDFIKDKISASNQESIST